jgi:hypothetical protein
MRERLTQEFAGATRQRLKRELLDRLDETHKFDPPESLVNDEFDLMWNSIKSEMDSSGKTFADEDTTEEKAKEDYRKIADRRVRLGLVLSEIGDKNKITVTDDEVSRAVIDLRGQGRRFHPRACAGHREEGVPRGTAQGRRRQDRRLIARLLKAIPDRPRAGGGDPILWTPIRLFC